MIKVLTANYTHKTSCPECKSVLAYCDNDLEKEIVAWVNSGPIMDSVRYFIRCPICNKKIILKTEK